jgi:Rad3-related DNA helicase
MGLVEVKGQNNYGCLWFANERRRLPGCDEGPCHAGIECELKSRGCYYYDAVRRAFSSRLVVTNYSYWMSVRRYGQPLLQLGQFGCLILDEAHDAANALSDFVRIEVSAKDVARMLDLPLPFGSKIHEWAEWARDVALPVCRTNLEAALTQVRLIGRGVTTVRDLQKMEGTLADLSSAGEWKRTDTPDPPAWVPGTTTDWIIEETRDTATFQPVWASGYAEKYLFGDIPRIFLVSATVTPRDASFLGIGANEYDFHEYPSPFKKNTRPIVVVPSARVSRHMTRGEERIWMARIDQIIEKEAVDKKQKGIIHAVSYDRAKLIYSMSKHRHLMDMHDRYSLRDTVAAFRAAPAPRILISPSVGTGWDFPYDQARFQIIAKVPFIDSRPAVIRARHKADKSYLDYVALVSLIQMAGRGTRSADDYCRTWIVDNNWGDWFYPRNRKIIPKWFKTSIRRVRNVFDA